MVKTLLFLIMVAISRYHAFVLRPRLSALLAASSDAPEEGSPEGTPGARLERTISALTAWVSINPYLGAGVLLCVAVMASSPPPV